jgi:hypothetical protein
MAVGDAMGGGARRDDKRLRMVTVAVSAEMVYQLVGSNMSSPQTAELNAGARAPTIKKWVNMTNAEAVAWLLFLSHLDGSLYPFLGGGLALGGMVLKYKYAIKWGLESGEPPTEDYRHPNGRHHTHARYAR